jgi:hypothetical protein
MKNEGKAAFISGLWFFLSYFLIFVFDGITLSWSLASRARYLEWSENLIFVSGVIWIVLLGRYFFKKFNVI